MQEPVLQDKRHEHVKFCEYARSLIVRVTGRPIGTFENFDLDRLYRVDGVLICLDETLCDCFSGEYCRTNENRL